jgi:hypothetical protein
MDSARHVIERHLTHEMRAQMALDESLVNSRRVIRCHLDQKFKVQNALVDVANIIHEALVGGAAGDLRGRAVQVDPMKPTLKAPGSKRLKL